MALLNCVVIREVKYHVVKMIQQFISIDCMESCSPDARVKLWQAALHGNEKEKVALFTSGTYSLCAPDSRSIRIPPCCLVQLCVRYTACKRKEDEQTKAWSLQEVQASQELCSRVMVRWCGASKASG